MAAIGIGAKKLLLSAGHSTGGVSAVGVYTNTAKGTFKQGGIGIGTHAHGPAVVHTSSVLKGVHDFSFNRRKTLATGATAGLGAAVIAKGRSQNKHPQVRGF